MTTAERAYHGLSRGSDRHGLSRGSDRRKPRTTHGLSRGSDRRKPRTTHQFSPIRKRFLRLHGHFHARNGPHKTCLTRGIGSSLGGSFRPSKWLCKALGSFDCA